MTNWMLEHPIITAILLHIIVVVALFLVLLWVVPPLVSEVCGAAIATDPSSFLSNLCK